MYVNIFFNHSKYYSHICNKFTFYIIYCVKDIIFMFKIKKQKYTVVILCTIYKTTQPDTIYHLLYTEIYLFHIINNATIYLLIISK